jgi:SAM-dependent methyltransferase
MFSAEINCHFGRCRENGMRILEKSEITTEELASQFESRREHAFNKILWCVPKDVKRGRFLDIGCGVGNGLVAALQHGFATAVGIDRDLNEFPWFDSENFDRYCETYGVNPSQAILIEGDLFKTKLNSFGFECVFMLDSIEHVPDPSAFIQAAAQYVAPGGVLLIDTCPLYFSKAGGHLFNHFDPEELPWVHLRSDFADLLARRRVDNWSIQRYAELNKVTHQEVRDAVAASGLEIVLEHRSTRNDKEAALLEANRAFLDFAKIPYEDLLFEDWLLIVGRRPA